MFASKVSISAAQFVFIIAIKRRKFCVDEVNCAYRSGKGINTYSLLSFVDCNLLRMKLA